MIAYHDERMTFPFYDLLGYQLQVFVVQICIVLHCSCLLGRIPVCIACTVHRTVSSIEHLASAGFYRFIG